MFNIRANNSVCLKWLLWSLLLSASAAKAAVPAIEMGKPETYCVVYCYIRAPFSITNYGPGQKVGRVFCDFDAEVTAALPVYKGETKTKGLQASSIGVFRAQDGVGHGDVEISTGVIKNYFLNAKTKSIRCHL